MLNYQLAETLMAQVFAAARLDGLDNKITVAVVDAHGELLCYARKDGSALHAGVLAINKAYTAARDRQTTANLAAWAKSTGKDMGYWADSKFTGIAGGVPVIIGGKVVGGIGVSGLAELEDERLAFAGTEIPAQV
jgi:glc operon protein GlcG